MSIIIGWIGVLFGLFISVPQIIKSIKEKSTKGVSVATYILLFLAVSCYLVRAIAIQEAIFIVSNSFNLVVTTTMLTLFYKYRS